MELQGEPACICRGRLRARLYRPRCNIYATSTSLDAPRARSCSACTHRPRRSSCVTRVSHCSKTSCAYYTNYSRASPSAPPSSGRPPPRPILPMCDAVHARSYMHVCMCQAHSMYAARQPLAPHSSNWKLDGSASINSSQKVCTHVCACVCAYVLHVFVRTSVHMFVHMSIQKTVRRICMLQSVQSRYIHGTVTIQSMPCICPDVCSTRPWPCSFLAAIG